jgi:hypothetical protein
MNDERSFIHRSSFIIHHFGFSVRDGGERAKRGGAFWPSGSSLCAGVFSYPNSNLPPCPMNTLNIQID